MEDFKGESSSRKRQHRSDGDSGSGSSSRNSSSGSNSKSNSINGAITGESRISNPRHSHSISASAFNNTGDIVSTFDNSNSNNNSNSSHSHGNKKKKRSSSVDNADEPHIPGGVSTELLEKYAHGDIEFSGISKIKFKGLKKTMISEKEKIIEAATKNAQTEILRPSQAGMIEMDNGVKVYKLKQKEMTPYLDLNTAKNAFEFQLHKFGPYNINYTPNGRNLIFAGKRGHIAILDILRMKINAEIQLQEEVHDVHYLHNETMFAAAQENFTYIYDSKGVEVHCMRNHERPTKLDYLPYHFLLVTGSRSGYIKWQDVSIGEYINGYQTGHGPIRVLKHNAQNAVSHVGHGNGVVSLWSPVAGKALVSMFCHKSPITDIGIDRGGNYMTTTGQDCFMKVWDLRMFKCLHSFRTDKNVTSMDISDRGMIALGMGREVQILQNAFTQPMDVTYLKHEIRTPNATLSSGGGVAASSKALLSSVQVHCVKFRPLEDVLCIGHSHGITSVIVPGSGEPNYDGFEQNPFTTSKQRKEAEVQNLLNKLKPDMIALDAAFIGSVPKDTKELQKDHNEIFKMANSNDTKKKSTKNKMRGKNKIAKKLRRKQKNVIDEGTEKMKEKLAKEKEDREEAKQVKASGGSMPKKVEFDPLQRFAKK